MSLLEQIIASGNRGPLRPPYTDRFKLDNHVRCVDGFVVSVLAGEALYCSPRPNSYGLGDVPDDYPGPYTAVEVGFPTERPEPWDGDDGWAQYADDPDDPTETVYSYVPVDMVRALVAAHGGEAS